ncbi:MAG TPA: TIGR03086 family metal-binding protein [Streptosporangiaceae bacterium]|nr:TIGR03086 family metal-binding protein [Streptosporangiaceae bacterium]
MTQLSRRFTGGKQAGFPGPEPQLRNSYAEAMLGPRLIADDLVKLHGRCGHRFAVLVAGVGAGQWRNDTPCSEWDVRTLVHHLLYEQRWVPLLLDGLTIEQVGDRFDGDLMGDDTSAWPGLLASVIEQAHAAVARPGALDQTVHLSYGDAPGQEYVLQLTADLAVHAWDLARATGQDDTLDPGAVALLLPWAEANAALLTASGMFGAPIDTGPNASNDARLLGLLGRAA